MGQGAINDKGRHNDPYWSVTSSKFECILDDNTT